MFTMQKEDIMESKCPKAQAEQKPASSQPCKSYILTHDILQDSFCDTDAVYSVHHHIVALLSICPQTGNIYQSHKQPPNLIISNDIFDQPNRMKSRPNTRLKIQSVSRHRSRNDKIISSSKTSTQTLSQTLSCTPTQN